MKIFRSHCGVLRPSDEGNTVRLYGWIHKIRAHKDIHFIDLRDRSGIVQLIVAHDLVDQKSIHLEYCVRVHGTVRLRHEKNPKIPTGEIEVQVSELQLLSSAPPLPFHIHEEAREDLRLRYRYLDLRSAQMQESLRIRHEAVFHCRSFLHAQSFYEIETPTMIRSTPEGARDFLVPSRNEPGTFYALAQSPQLYKQMLMIGGLERYFQIARCYRDEDTRGDRQPEHSQIDMEMSFVDAEDIQSITERLLSYVVKNTLDVDLVTAFPRLKYHDAMNRYGSDKPDLRFALPLQDFRTYAEKSDFSVFKHALAEGGTVKCLVVKEDTPFSRKYISELESIAKLYGAKGLPWTRVTSSSTFQGGIARFLEAQAKEVIHDLSLSPGSLLFFSADQWNIACTALGALRATIGKKTLTDHTQLSFAWIVDFPLFTEGESGWEASHHMFTQPKDPAMLAQDPASVIGELYDLVCNGSEIASGSMRIHSPTLQQKIFDIVGLAQKDAAQRFGFFLEALRYSPPPHGGIALGLDRLIMILCGRKSIRDVIAFPKNTAMASPLDGSPAAVPPETLQELGLAIKKNTES